MKKGIKEPKLSKSLASKLGSILQTSAPKDFDIENVGLKDPTQGNESEGESEDSELGREHYVQVGTSQLRKNLELPIADNPVYKGKSVNRNKYFEESEQEGSVEEDEEESDQVLEDEDEGEQQFEDGEASDQDLDQEDIDEVIESDEEGVSPFNGIDDDGEAQFDSEGEDEGSYGGISDDSEDLMTKEYNEQDEVGLSEEGAPEDGSDASEAASDDLETQLANELKQAQLEETKFNNQLTQRTITDAEKGKHLKNQLAFWESSLELRIRIQKLMGLAHQLPQKDTSYQTSLMELEKRVSGTENGGAKEAEAVSFEQVEQKLTELVHTFLDTQLEMWPKAQVDSNETIPTKPNLPTKRTQPNSTESIWQDISSVYDAFNPYVLHTLEKWNSRVKLSENLIGNAKKFKALDQSITTQVTNILNDKERLIRRSQLKRSKLEVLGKKAEEPTEGEGKDGGEEYDCEIYNDDDFYQQLLREFIESRMVDSADPSSAPTTTRWAAAKQDKNHTNKVVDLRASKGRKVRYHVHDKLVAFMAPLNQQQWQIEMIDELYANLFNCKTSLKEDLPVEEDNVIKLNDTKGLKLFG